MALTYSTPGELGSVAPEFALPGVDGKTYRLEEFRGSKALVIVFMCNHCPYVIAVQKRINTLAREYASQGVSVVGINSNDSDEYPEDGVEEMRKRAQEQEYAFPYLWDKDQTTARAYGAVCTPEFFVFSHENHPFVLKYKGRLDDHWKDEGSVTRRDLALALDEILAGKNPSPDQKPAMGCSIKWKKASLS